MKRRVSPALAAEAVAALDLMEGNDPIVNRHKVRRVPAPAGQVQGDGFKPAPTAQALAVVLLLRLGLLAL